jgi:hypothetical protein
VEPERELFEWERQHSALTPEGQIENAAAFGRGLSRHRTAVGRVFLTGALAIAAMLVISAIARS